MGPTIVEEESAYPVGGRDTISGLGADDAKGTGKAKIDNPMVDHRSIEAAATPQLSHQDDQGDVPVVPLQGIATKPNKQGGMKR